jgi:hypothetical protein
VTVDVNVTAAPTVPVVGPMIATERLWVITICLELEAVWAFPSVTVTETVNVPVLAYIVVKLEPEPEAGLPPVAVQANAYGPVPPEPVAVKATADEIPPVVGPLIATANAMGLMTIVVDAVVVLVLESVPVTETVKLPLVPYVVVKLAPVPDDGVPPVAVQENVYGLVPPDPVAVKVTAVPAVPVVGPLIATARVRGLIVMVAVAVAVLAFASVTVTLIVKVPLALYIVVRLAPVPDAGLPDVAVHANE